GPAIEVRRRTTGRACQTFPPGREAMGFELREVYCPGHFGNSYEVMWPREMRAYLEEIRHWGFNRYGDWLDVAQLCDPAFMERVGPARYRDALWTMTHELASRKKGILRTATDLGLAADVVITPNHVYLDQMRPELLAERAPEMIGQLICPGKPAGRELILE